MITLRPRQKKLFIDITEVLKKDPKLRKIIVQAPCGFGKTPLMVTMIEGSVKKNKKVLFLAPRKELIGQCSEMLSGFGVEHGILNNPKKFNIFAPVQLTCWQTLKNQKTNFVPDVIFYDECHGSVSEKAIEVLNRYPEAYLFGFTATPYRDDGLGLSDLYDVLVTSCQTSDLINEGLLIKPEYYNCSEGEPVSQTAITSDSTEEQISIDDADVLIKADLIRNFTTICKNAKTVVFCPSMEKAEEVAERFRKAGFTANSVDAKTPTKKREEILKDFENNKFQILCNAMLLKEGWDCPSLECVIILRNLMSRVFFRQGCNRCMRIDKNNPNKKAYILDFFNCLEKFGLPWEDEEYSLEEGVKRKEEKILEDKNNDSNKWFCQNCAQITSSEEGICTFCGTPRTKTKKIIAEAVSDLVKVDEKKTLTKMHKQKEYNRLCAICIDKGWNPATVAHRYKEITGKWPKDLQKTEKWKEYCEEFEKKKRKNLHEKFKQETFF